MFDFMDMDFNGGYPTPSGPYIPEASDCLRCGLCVNTCPTFKLFQTAEETPRNRIRTISKILSENQAISADEHEHLHNCLQCRACETVCPSKMAYGALFDQAQAHLQTKPDSLSKLALGLIANKHWRIRLLPLLMLYLASGLRKPLRWTGWLGKLHLAEAEALLTKPNLRSLARHYPATPTKLSPEGRNKRGQVALFTGCLAEHFDQDTLQAAITLLNAIGYGITVPSGQTCCGAIHQHNGQAATAFINQNINAFNALDVDAVLYTATGCGVMLSEYRHDGSDAEERFTTQLQDINVFLLAHWPDDLVLRPLPGTVAVHEPCSQRNVLKNQQATYDLLAKIPELTISALPDNTMCCGAGGSYLLTHPDNASQLRDLKRQAIKTFAADRVVSCNFVCSAFLNADGGNITHPLQLLAQQLPKK